MSRLLIAKASFGGFLAGTGAVSTLFNLHEHNSQMFVSSGIAAFVCGCLVIAICVVLAK